ncbi:hypothetical protein [Neptuniibacter caesariensis]|uniref:Uncharacterized protein n=1 Tax=Neptuniibacter caesariensis TaxID=207954 RepID=A0A7U8C245_NEPCE|nr:hypothetical protein [Neptuniibacter caesariensis]EAR60093.1 hypothetical protein MED92_17177 [Oceanospirillum sp. MED92] [Neptuniibacter caesariensis]
MYDMQYDAMDLVHSGMTLEQFKKMLELIDVNVILEEKKSAQIISEQQYFVPVVQNGIVIGRNYLAAT